MRPESDPIEREARLTPPLDVVAQLSGTEFLALLAQKDVHLGARDGLLVVNAPSGVLDETLRSELKRRKQELLALLMVSPDVAPAPLRAAAARGSRAPMTPSQQGMWLIDHFDPGNVAYNIPVAFAFPMLLDRERMQTAVNWIIGRHEILRTSFHQEDAEVFQLVADAAQVEVGCTDLSSFPEDEADERGRALIREYAQRPFDLRRAPLLSVHCIRVRPAQDVLFLNIHHIVADQHSLYVLLEELMECYRALEEGRSPELPPLALHYADYAVWLAQEIGGERFARQIEYWKQKLAGLPHHLELPARHAYPEERTARGATISFPIAPEDKEALAQIGRNAGATPFMVFLALYGLLLARFSGKDDFCIGSPLTQRKHAETQQMLGLFMNMVPYRMKFHKQQSFGELLRQVRTTALEAFEHGDVPFQTLVRELRFNRRSLYAPIFQVMFGFEPLVSAKQGGLQLNTNPGTARYDLSMILSETGDGAMLGLFEYRTDLFHAEDIQALADRFLWLVKAVTKDPEGQFFSPPATRGTMERSTEPQPEAVEREGGVSLLGRLSKMFSRLRE